MKSLGIVRNIDDLGRLVIPSELRKKLYIKERDSMEFFTDGDNIIIRKYKTNVEKDKLNSDLENMINTLIVDGELKNVEEAISILERANGMIR